MEETPMVLAPDHWQKALTGINKLKKLTCVEKKISSQKCTN